MSGSGSSYEVAVSGFTGGGSVTASIGAGKATDAAGNANTASTSTNNTVNYDPVRPSVTVNQASGQAVRRARCRSASASSSASR